MICEICNKDFSSLTGLHGHLTKVHRETQENYYHTFRPRRDLYDNSLINYKNYQQYFESDFNDRESFCNWIMDNYKKPFVKEYCETQIKQRATKKLITILPGQVCLKSLMIPSIIWMERIYGGVENFIQELDLIGIKTKYDYLSKPIIDLNNDLTIFVDTREQLPLDLKSSTKKMALNVGDYTADKPYFSNIFIERKSLADICGTLSNGIERFEREIEKAKTIGAYLIVLVECLYSDAINYSANSRFNQKMNGQHLFYQIRRLSQEYSDVIQFVFTGSRSRSTIILEKILRMKDQAKTLDLELLKDLGEI